MGFGGGEGGAEIFCSFCNPFLLRQRPILGLGTSNFFDSEDRKDAYDVVFDEREREREVFPSFILKFFEQEKREK